MSKPISELQVLRMLSEMWARIKVLDGDYVSLTKPNEVEAPTIFYEGYIYAKDTVVSVLNNSINNAMSSNSSYCGSPAFGISQGTTIDEILIGMHDSVQIGDIVNHVNIGLVRSSDNTVLEYLNYSENLFIEEYNGDLIEARKIIRVPFKYEASEDIWFLLGCESMGWGARRDDLSHTSVGGSSLPRIGAVLQPNLNNYFGQVCAVTNSIPMESLVNNLIDKNYLDETFLNKNKENVVIGKTTFINGYVPGEAIAILNNTNATSYMKNNTSYSGSPSMSASANTYVSYIEVAVRDDFNVGDVLNEFLEQVTIE